MTLHEVKDQVRRGTDKSRGYRNPGAKFRLPKSAIYPGSGGKQGVKNQQKPLDPPGCPGGRTQGIADDRRITPI